VLQRKSQEYIAWIVDAPPDEAFEQKHYVDRISSPPYYVSTEVVRRFAWIVVAVSEVAFERKYCVEITNGTLNTFQRKIEN
jgi:hypothetical protein